MASKVQKKLEKRKSKEREDKKKILMRRESTRAKAKEEREDYRKTKRIRRLRENTGMNIWSDEVFKKMDESTLKQLEHNAKIMKTLEDEYERDLSEKRKLNQDLEAEGYKTLDEKISVLHKDTLRQQQLAEIESANRVEGMVIAPPVPKDTADVQVIKAPISES